MGLSVLMPDILVVLTHATNSARQQSLQMKNSSLASGFAQTAAVDRNTY